MTVFKKIFGMVLIVIMILAFNFRMSVNAENELIILSETNYIDNLGNYHIVGELKNKGDKPVNFVQVTATYYDSNNVVIDTRFDLSMLYTILPGRISPFKVSLLDASKSAKVKSYSLKVSYKETTPILERIEILNSKSEIDSKGNLLISGVLKNLGEKSLTNCRIVATFYNSSGDIIDAKMLDLDPELIGEIYQNRTVSFEIILEKERVALVKNYNLFAESNEYAFIEESKFTLVIVIIGKGIVVKEPDDDAYSPGSSVKLNAIPSEGWVFSKWDGNITGNENPITIIVNDNLSIKAVFVRSQNETEEFFIIIAVIGVIAVILVTYIMIKKFR